MESDAHEILYLALWDCSIFLGVEPSEFS